MLWIYYYFRENSFCCKLSRSVPNSVYVDIVNGDNVQGILGAIGPFWAKWGLGRVPRSPSFSCVEIQKTFRHLRNGRFSPNLVTKRSSVSRRGIRKDIFTKSEVDNRSNRHLIQSTGCTAERYCLLHVVVQESGSFRDLVNSTTYGCKFAQFPDFGLFSLTP